MNYYEILQCKPSDDIAVIKSSHRKLALQYHPDKVHDKDSHEMYLKINEAWNTLRDPELRRVYNAKLYESKFNNHVNTINTLETGKVTIDDKEVTYHCRCGGLNKYDKEILEDVNSVIECDNCSMAVDVKDVI